MATTLEIVRGISQVMAGTYDGALDDNGEPIKIGLKREEGHPINDSRVMDGFSVKFMGPQLCICYQAEIRLKDTHSKDFENDLEQTINDIAKFIKKEYKKLTGSALNLKPAGDVEAIVQNTSRVRTWVQAQKNYDIAGIESSTEPIDGETRDTIDAKFKEFIGLGGWSKAKPQTTGQPIYDGAGKVKSRKDIHSAFKAE